MGSWEFTQAKSEVVIQLPEKSVILDLLFQFCYPECHPDLNHLTFDILAELAEAVEKYEVFSAISICKIAMKDALPLNAFDVLIYGATYAHPDIYQKAAPIVVLQKSLSEVLPRLPAILLIPWASYHEQWRHIAENGASYYEIWAKDYQKRFSPISRYDEPCRECGGQAEKHVALLLQRLGAGLQFLANLDTLFPTCSHSARKDMFHSWRSSIEENIKNIQPFNPRPVSSVGSAMPLSLITSWNEISDQSVSARFCAPDFDVTFQSSDGILFLIHKINLEVSAGSFVPSEFETHNEIARLTETAMTLDLLFQFCYPVRHPDVEALEFGALALLAEAAEKYQVFSAMNICNICIRKQLPEHAADILAYAARHDYPDILDIAAPLVVVEEILSETLPKLPPNTILRWVKYYETVHPPRHNKKRSQVSVPNPILPFSTF